MRKAGDDENPNKDPRAEALYNFITETFFHYQHQLDWESTIVHTLPILAHELDDDSFWGILSESKNKKKLGVSLGVYPKRHEVIKRLGEALWEYSRIYDNPDKREVGLRKMVLRGAAKITELRDELTELNGELDVSKAQIATQEEIEKQLTSRLAELESTLEASNAEAAELRTSLETERTESQRLHSAIEDIKVELLSSGVYYSSAKIQELF